MDRFDVIDDNEAAVQEDIRLADQQMLPRGLRAWEPDSAVAGSELVLTYDDIVNLNEGRPLAR